MARRRLSAVEGEVMDDLSDSSHERDGSYFISPKGQEFFSSATDQYYG